jgi:iron complex outermembrane receptor protein
MKDLRLRKFSAVLSLFAAYGLMTTTGKAQATTTTTSTTTTTTPAPAATTTSDQEPQVLEKFVVTGSNIPMAADALAVPVTVIGQQQIEESGVSSSILEILRKGSPQFSGNGNIGNENAQVQTNTYGGASVAIHNLPTLVLIDGQRVAVDPITAQGGGEFVDVNMIPVAAVDRIEVLSDGASAIYGSDAIGGVVNIILKKDFNGFDIGARYAFTTNAGHYAERQGWIVGGAANDSTSILTSVEFTEQDPIFEKDRSYSNPYYGTNTYPGHLDVFLGSGGFADQFYQLAPGVNAPPGGGLYTIDQLVSMGVYVPITPTQSLDALNLANAETLSQSLKRASALTNITHKIFGEKLEGYASILFSNVKTISQLNGQPIVPYLSTPYTDLIDEGTTPPPTGATYIPLSAPTNPFSAAFINGNQDFASGALVLPRMRLLNFPRTENNDDTLIRIVGGLKGKVSDALQWDVSANLNRYELNYTNGGLINTANLNAAFADGTLNPFAINQAPGVLPGDIVGSAFFNGVSTLNDFNAKIFGNVFDVPGGQIGYSLGVEYQVAQLSAQVDANSLPDPDTGTTVGWSNSVSLQPFQAQRDILSVYAEVSAPLIGASENIPFVHSLNLDIAGRYDDYSAIGGSKVPKASLSYEPIDDTLKIRFSASKSFIAPTLYDLYGPSSTGSTDLLTYNNFGGGQTVQAQYNSVSQTNPELKPSTATAWTTGFVWTPKQVKGLEVSVDYYQIVQKQIVGSYSQQAIVQSVELLGAASPFDQYVHLFNPKGALLSMPGQLSAAGSGGAGLYIDTPLINQAAQAVKGIDVSVEYKWGTTAFGKFDFATTASIYNSYLLQQLPTEDYFQYAGHATQNNGTLPRYRTYTTLTWSYYGADATVANTFIPTVTDIGAGGDAEIPPTNVSSFIQWDFNVAYKLSELHLGHWFDGFIARVGVNNVFNAQPPLAVNAFPDSYVDLSTYNGPIGREYFVSFDYKF